MGFGIPDNICNTSLFLGLGDTYCHNQENLSLPHDHQKKHINNNNNNKNLSLKKDHLFPSLSLGLPQETCSKAQPDSPSAVSVSSNTTIVKKEKEMVVGGRCDQEVEVEEEKERVCSRASDEEEGGSPRKKLRLTKEQSTVLEDRFKDQSTLSPKQKFALAEQLNLRPRQVEVWFQNRRARTKLKQTEVDCELLKRCCETLSEENKRLQKEIQELKYSFKHSPPFHIQLPTTSTPTMCPSCERIGGGLTNDSSPTSSTVTARPKTLFYKPLTHPSAA